jgi:hypothetical protein
VPEAALPTQPQGSDAEVDAVPAAEVVLAGLTPAEELDEAPVPDAGAGELVLLAAGSFTKEARSVVPAATMIWELAAGSGTVGPPAAEPDPTIAALAATVASAAATGSVACQATEAPAMSVWDSGLEAASATAWDVSESGAWRSVGSDDWDAAGTAVAGIACPEAANRGLVEYGFTPDILLVADRGNSRFSPNRWSGIGNPVNTAPVFRSARVSDLLARCTRARALVSLIPIFAATSP